MSHPWEIKGKDNNCKAGGREAFYIKQSKSAMTEMVSISLIQSWSLEAEYEEMGSGKK